MDESLHSLLLPFDTDDAEFVRGFEAGRIWAVLAQDETADVAVTVHACNSELVMRMAEVPGS